MKYFISRLSAALAALTAASLISATPEALAGGVEPTLVLPVGTAAPSPSGVPFHQFHPIDFADDGSFYFNALLDDGSYFFSFYRLTPGLVVESVRVYDDSAPVEVGGTYTSVRGHVAPNGAFAYFAEITGGSAAEGVFVNTGGSDTVIALAGGSAPDTGGGLFASFSKVRVNDAGRVLLLASVTGGSASSGLFLHDGVSLSAVALVGDPAPGGGTIGGIDRPALSSSGDVAYVMDEATDNTAGRLVHVSGGVETVVAQLGDPVPGLPGETYYDQGALVGTFDAFDHLRFDESGVLYFAAALEPCWVATGFPGINGPETCALMSYANSAASHLVGEHLDGLGYISTLDVEEGLGAMLMTGPPIGIRLWHDGVVLPLVLDDTADVMQAAGSSRMGPGGRMIFAGRLNGVGLNPDLYATPELAVAAPLLGLRGAVALCITIALTGAAVASMYVGRRAA